MCRRCFLSIGRHGRSMRMGTRSAPPFTVKDVYRLSRRTTARSDLISVGNTFGFVERTCGAVRREGRTEWDERNMCKTLIVTSGEATPFISTAGFCGAGDFGVSVCMCVWLPSIESGILSAQSFLNGSRRSHIRAWLRFFSSEAKLAWNPDGNTVS
jgi:hypothetical protein